MNKKNKFKIGLIGYGKWGKKIYKNLVKYKELKGQVFSKHGKNSTKKI